MVSNMDEIETLTPEQIARHYSAAMDSVNLINGERPKARRTRCGEHDWP